MLAEGWRRLEGACREGNNGDTLAVTGQVPCRGEAAATWETEGPGHGAQTPAAGKPEAGVPVLSSWNSTRKILLHVGTPKAHGDAPDSMVSHHGHQANRPMAPCPDRRGALRGPDTPLPWAPHTRPGSAQTRPTHLGLDFTPKTMWGRRRTSGFPSLLPGVPTAAASKRPAPSSRAAVTMTCREQGSTTKIRK